MVVSVGLCVQRLMAGLTFDGIEKGIVLSVHKKSLGTGDMVQRLSA